MKRTGKKLVAGLLASIAVCSAFAFTGCDYFGKTKEDPTDKPSASVPGTSETPQYDGTIVQAGGKYNLSNKIAFLGADVTPTGENGEYTPVSAMLTATVLPETANQAVIWDVLFVNPASAWAKNKTVTDYVTVTPAGENGTSATVTCLAPFGEQIQIECASQDNLDVKAICTVDLLQAVENVSLTFGSDFDINLGGRTNVVWEINEDGIGRGGEANVVIDTSDVYTVAVNYSWDIDLIEPHYYARGEGVSNWGVYVWDTSISFDASGSDGYFVLNGQDCGLKKLENITSLIFNNDFFETSLAGYFEPSLQINYLFRGTYGTGISNDFKKIEEGSLYTLRLTVSGKNFSQEYTSLLYLTGYTNTSKVQSVVLDKDSIEF